MSYARNTGVPIGRTRTHIEELLTQYKADSIGVMTESAPPRATVIFRIHGWGVRMRISMPTADEFSKVKVGRHPRKLTTQECQQRAEQAARERWRALYLALKAKLVSVETGVETFEEAFLPHLVLKGGQTVLESIRPQLGPGASPGDLSQLSPGGQP